MMRGQHYVHALGRGVLAVILMMTWQTAGGDDAPQDLGVQESKPPDFEAREAAMRRTMGGEVRIKHTPHFIVAYQEESPILDEFTVRLEHTYHGIQRFADLLDVPIEEPEQKLEVLFFHTPQDYYRHGASIGFRAVGTYGVFMEDSNRASFFNVENDPALIQMQQGIADSQASVDRLIASIDRVNGDRTRIRLKLGDGSWETLTRAEALEKLENTRQRLNRLKQRRASYIDHINRTVIQHETAHQVAFNFGLHTRGAQNPKWFVEGVACLLETPPSRFGGGFGVINQYRLDDLRDAVDPGHEKRKLKTKDVVEAMKEGRCVSPRQLVEDASLFEIRGPQLANVYASSWALVQYLFRHEREAFSAYVRDLQARRPGQRFTPGEERALFETRFGKIDPRFERRWAAYVISLKYRGYGGQR